MVNKDFHIVQNEIEENEYTLQAYSTEKTRQTWQENDENINVIMISTGLLLIAVHLMMHV